ncbi:MAG TPA: DUF1109 domain-containing protein [Rhodopila sp.]|uniref:DUF1109 domain-containing protein n=1 Tax=Rhodopila sp. TaxID=2480087 RepID=UPI002C590B4D|nr:DUF1109 domain-containing protein [Rhodopila sp.]HVY15373.1 DUF1109 domain-containing protein [Rhodopila sp.]
MRTDSLVDRLSQNLRPVRPRSIRREALLLLLLGVVEIIAFLGMGFMRPDMPVAMEAPSFWWKLTSMGLIAVLGAGVAILSVDPVRSPRRGLRWILVCIAVIFATGWLIDAAGDGLAGLIHRLDWTQGVQCVWKMVVLSIPPAIALGGLIRRGAPTDRSGTALAAGLSSAAWGAFVFVFACPSDDPLYIAVWYTVGCSIVTLLGRAILMWLSRW